MLEGINIRAEMNIDQICDLASKGLVELSNKIKHANLMSREAKKAIVADISFLKRLYERLEQGNYIESKVKSSFLGERITLDNAEGEKNKKVVMWIKRCQDNLIYFRENSIDLSSSEKSIYISNQYSLLYSINSVLTGSAKIGGSDQYLFTEEKDTRNRLRWSKMRESYYGNIEA